MFEKERNFNLVNLPIIFLIISNLYGCALNKAEVILSPEEIYSQAIDFAKNKDFKSSNILFEKLNSEHPYSKWTINSQIMLGWVFYEDNKYDLSILASEKFIADHPNHELVPYAYYLIALSYYERIVDVERDAEITLLAKKSFEELIIKFPESKYSKDAKLKIQLTLNNLAGKEMAIGRFYQSASHYPAAIERFKTVVKEYEKTDQIPEALLRLSECYLMMGANEDAQKVSSVLIYNFPESVWTKKLPFVLEKVITPSEDIEAGKVIIEEKRSFFSILKSIFKND